MPRGGRRRASDVFVECLEAEGVKYVFGIPGEETLDLNQSLANSSVSFVPVRHEQGGAYMADMYGRLTGRAGVCLGTLGPGAMNLVTAIGDAFLDRAPLVALTGQADLERMHKESHQFIDLVELFRPITKWNARVTSPEIIPEVVRKAFKVAESEKPGATHLELPEDVMAAELDAAPLPRRRPGRARARRARAAQGRRPHPQRDQPGRARRQRRRARRRRARAARVLPRDRHRRRRDVHGQGRCSTTTDPKALGTVGLQSRDYAMAGFEDADVVIAIGYDLVEHAPKHWNPRRDKKIVVIDSEPAEIDEYFTPEVELVGDIYHVLTRLAEECRDVPHSGGSQRLRDVVLGPLRGRPRTTTHFPMQPPRALWEIRQALGREDILISDVGLHKLWIGRMFPAHEPNTVLIANGLAGMGFARAVRDRGEARAPRAASVVTVNGDGGFLMNCQELETAMRLKTPVVNVVWENRQYGSIVWKQDKKFGEHFGVDFTNPDFVQARRGLRHAGVALRGGRRLRPPPAPRADARRPVADRPADRLLDRRRDQRGARGRDGARLG